MLCWCGFGSGSDVGDDGFAVADSDVLASERLELIGEIAGLTPSGTDACTPEPKPPGAESPPPNSTPSPTARRQSRSE